MNGENAKNVVAADFTINTNFAKLTNNASINYNTWH